MPSWWVMNSHKVSQEEDQRDEEHSYNNRDNNKTSTPRNNKNKKQKQDEAVLLARISSRNSQDFKISSICFQGSSVLSGFDSGVGSEIEEKKAYPLPQPSKNFDLKVVGFVPEMVLVLPSSQSSSGSPSPEHDDDDVSDHGDFGSFRAIEETRGNSWSRTSSPELKVSNINASPQYTQGWDADLESPSEKQVNGRHPCHPLPLPPCSPTKSSQHMQSKWKKGKLLGRGTFGHVYAGFNSENGQMCAMKEVNVISDDQDSNECLKQLNQEIALLSELSHPNIIQYYGSKLGVDKLSVYLEYVSGGSIHKLLREYGSFKEPVIRNYTKQILSGLVYLHGRNTVHRDIKGANILVDPNGEIKLADFGLAIHIQSHASMLSFKGSPYWMAPEVIMNTSGYTFAIDIWSLGCTIIEMATSKPPWSQYEGVAAIFKIASGKDFPKIPINLSEDAQGFVKLCLQRDPSARPTAAQLLHHPFIQMQATRETAKVNHVVEDSSTSNGRYYMAEFQSGKTNVSTQDREHSKKAVSEPPRTSRRLWDGVTITSLPTSVFNFISTM